MKEVDKLRMYIKKCEYNISQLLVVIYVLFAFIAVLTAMLATLMIRISII
jgi:hypothetical protein